MHHFSRLYSNRKLSLHHQACISKFVQAGHTYIYNDYSQNQTISAGQTCTTNSTNYGNCYKYDSKTNTTSKQCYGSLGGTIHAHGFTNLSLSSTESASLYNLVYNATVPGYKNSNLTSWFPGSGISQSLDGCADPAIWDVQCIPVGQYGFYRFIPELYCVNGTLDECTNGPVVNGTAISICGVISESIRSDKGSGDQVAYRPVGAVPFIETTREVALAMVSDPAKNTTCTAFYSGATNRNGRDGSLLVAVVILLSIFIS